MTNAPVTPIASVCSSLGGVLEPVTLPADGPYVVVVDPQWGNTGTATVRLSDVVNVAGSLTINDPAAPISLSNPGQLAQLTFGGTQGQQVTVRFTAVTIGGTTPVRLLRPDLTQQTSGYLFAAPGNLATQTLPTTGTYTVVIDPVGGNAGTVSVHVTSP